MKLIFEKTVNEETLANLAENISEELLSVSEFCLWLDAPMGAGKTTLSRYLLRKMGLDEKIPVTSPTYTYINEYNIDGRWLAHLDLYRLEGASDLQDLGIAETRPFSGYIVEWPNAVEDPEPLHPTHILKIESTKSSCRTYKFYRL
jgi:tRNA threonylcarbamoyl adenosine modification protein YjeE